MCNNYLLNRRWTFDGRADTAAFQLPRFLTISVAAFLLSFAVLEFGVAVVGLKELLAQAIAIVVATPVNFVGNKVWTFSVGRRHAA